MNFIERRLAVGTKNHSMIYHTLTIIVQKFAFDSFLYWLCSQATFHTVTMRWARPCHRHDVCWIPYEQYWHPVGTIGNAEPIALERIIDIHHFLQAAVGVVPGDHVVQEDLSHEVRPFHCRMKESSPSF